MTVRKRTWTNRDGSLSESWGVGEAQAGSLNHLEAPAGPLARETARAPGDKALTGRRQQQHAPDLHLRCICVASAADHLRRITQMQNPAKSLILWRPGRESNP
jgi:hypothetical protein